MQSNDSSELQVGGRGGCQSEGLAGCKLDVWTRYMHVGEVLASVAEVQV